MRCAYVNVFVSDLDRATAFYGGTLGLALASCEPDHGYASFHAGPVSLGVALADETQADLVGRHTGVGWAVSDLEVEYIRLSGLGVEFPMLPSRQPWGGFMAMFADPDANLFYLDEIAAMHP